MNPIALANKRTLINILFRAVSETLAEFARTHLRGQLGFLAVLHTWDQTLGAHFHLHCLVPAGARSLDKRRWIPARSNFLFHVRALSIVFRAKFLDRLHHAFRSNHLQFPGRTGLWAEAPAFQQRIQSLRKQKWVVYAKRPFASPDSVLDYLARYTHRVAISNHRIRTVEPEGVSFLYRDRKKGDSVRTMTLDTDEFIRRFLLHVLPRGLMRIRHFGFMANRHKASNLARCRQLLAPAQIARKPRPPQPLLEWIAQPRPCPSCRDGTLINIRILPPLSWDSS